MYVWSCILKKQLEVNQSILEAQNDQDVDTPIQKEPTPSRTRNRPKREPELSGR